MPASEVFIVKTAEREFGVKTLLGQFRTDEFKGKLAIKANYNSADPFPASTHISTLEKLVEHLRGTGVSSITLAERSGMGDTESVLREMGVLDLAAKQSFKTIVLNTEGKERWEKIEKGDTHWLHGFLISKEFTEADSVVQTCCLKTHRFGGHFTLSLKNSVGLAAKRVPGNIYDYMWELHSTPNQRQKIAEINSFYKTDLVLIDGIKAFVSEGPEKGREVEPNLMLASKDRVALDAVGVAILRRYGATGSVAKGKVFEQDQLKRASELEIGARSPSDVKIVPLNDVDEAGELEAILNS